jgi:hypothetical protein
MPDELIALAERCERAEGPDRALDARIWCVIGVGSPWTAENCWLAATVRPPELESLGLTLEQWLDKWPDEADAAAQNYNVPRYTASLDAANALVPKGWSVERSGWQAIAEPYYAGFELWQYRKNADGEYRHGSSEAITKGSAVTPALALCAAALRARATTEPTP